MKFILPLYFIGSSLAQTAYGICVEDPGSVDLTQLPAILQFGHTLTHPEGYTSQENVGDYLAVTQFKFVTKTWSKGMKDADEASAPKMGPAAARASQHPSEYIPKQGFVIAAGIATTYEFVERANSAHIEQIFGEISLVLSSSWYTQRARGTKDNISVMITSYGFCGAVSMKDRKLVRAINEPLRRMSWAAIDYTDTKRNFGYYGQSFVVPLGIFDGPGVPSPTQIEGGVLRTPSGYIRYLQISPQS